MTVRETSLALKFSMLQSMLKTCGRSTTRWLPPVPPIDDFSEAAIMPGTIKENQRLLEIVRSLIDKRESRTPEETAALEVLITLIHRFEQEHYRPERAKPHEVLAYLMEEHGL